MSEKNFYLSRRNFLGLTAAAVLPLSACQTAMKTPGKVVGASAAANFKRASDPLRQWPRRIER